MGCHLLFLVIAVLLMTNHMTLMAIFAVGEAQVMIHAYNPDKNKNQ